MPPAPSAPLSGTPPHAALGTSLEPADLALSGAPSAAAAVRALFAREYRALDDAIATAAQHAAFTREELARLRHVEAERATPIEALTDAAWAEALAIERQRALVQAFAPGLPVLAGEALLAAGAGAAGVARLLGAVLLGGAGYQLYQSQGQWRIGALAPLQTKRGGHSWVELTRVLAESRRGEAAAAVAGLLLLLTGPASAWGAGVLTSLAASAVFAWLAIQAVDGEARAARPTNDHGAPLGIAARAVAVLPQRVFELDEAAAKRRTTAVGAIATTPDFWGYAGAHAHAPDPRGLDLFLVGVDGKAIVPLLLVAPLSPDSAVAGGGALAIGAGLPETAGLAVFGPRHTTTPDAGDPAWAHAPGLGALACSLAGPPRAGLAARVFPRWVAAVERAAGPHLDALAGVGEAAAAPLRDLAAFTARAAEHQRSRAALDARAAAWDGVFLPADTVRRLAASVLLFERGDPAAPAGMLLYGPPGTGKTEIARRVARFAGCAFFATSAAELKADHIGGTEQAVRALWARARQKQPCVVFVDECDATFPARTAAGTDAFARSAVEGFLAEWQGLKTGDRVFVVGATNHRERIDPAILSRFGESVEIATPDAQARAGILAAALAEMGGGFAGEVPAEVVSASQGLAGRDLRTLVQQAKRDALGDGGVIIGRHLAASLARLRGRAAHAVREDATWDTLVLPDPVLRELRTSAEMLRHAEVLAQQGMAPPRGLLLYGPPGTGKTQIARTLARESGLHFEALGVSNLKAGFVGQTAQLVRGAFERARQAAPAILFLDELDIVAPRRGGGNEDQFTKDLVGELLTQMDGAVHAPQAVFVVAATNRPDTLDEAVLSRFPRRIEVGLPDAAGRARILRALLAGKPLAADVEGALEAVAAHTAGRSGRDLRSLVDSAGLAATSRALAAGTPEAVRIGAPDLLAQVPALLPAPAGGVI